MKKTLLSLVAFAFATALSAQSLSLSATAKGIVVDGGSHGRFVLGAPVIGGSDKKDLKPSFVPAEDGTSATATYADGTVINIELSSAEGVITYRFNGVLYNAKSVKISTTIPIDYSSGGTYSLNNEEAKPFPYQPEKQLFAQGAFSRVAFDIGTGEGLAFQTPTSYQQLQDNRIWDTRSYSWIYHYDLGRYPEALEFRIKVSTFKK